jgi:hypothetical protein
LPYEILKSLLGKGLAKFNPLVASSPKNTLSGKNVEEFAPGIPKGRKTHSLPELKDKTWTLAVQEHKAKRAGKHWDARLVDPRTGHAHSWALPKTHLPVPGERPVLAVRTPTHTADYALHFGEKKPRVIGKGYGKGRVVLKQKDPIKVLSSKNNRVKFIHTVDGDPNEFLLFQTGGDKWLMKNVTPTVKSAAFVAGYNDVLVKLGFKSNQSGMKGRKLPPSEAQSPLEVDDDSMSAGTLAEMLSDLPEQKMRTEDKDTGARTGLNSNTNWSDPQSMSSSDMTSSSPLLPGMY